MAKVQARTGIIFVTGEPVRAGVSVLENEAGTWLATGVLAAIAKRFKTGKGSLSLTSLYETGISCAQSVVLKLVTQHFYQMEFSRRKRVICIFESGVMISLIGCANKLSGLSLLKIPRCAGKSSYFCRYLLTTSSLISIPKPGFPRGG